MSFCAYLSYKGKINEKTKQAGCERKKLMSPWNVKHFGKQVTHSGDDTFHHYKLRIKETELFFAFVLRNIMMLLFEKQHL